MIDTKAIIIFVNICLDFMHMHIFVLFIRYKYMILIDHSILGLDPIGEPIIEF